MGNGSKNIRTKPAPIRGASLQREIRRDLKAWRALAGIWRGEKIKNPVQWQRKIRKEWERALP